jgi:hypothetical protein
MAHILKDIPQYCEQARTAAHNAMVCLSEPQQQPPRVTAEDIHSLPQSLR